LVVGNPFRRDFIRPELLAIFLSHFPLLSESLDDINTKLPVACDLPPEEVSVSTFPFLSIDEGNFMSQDIHVTRDPNMVVGVFSTLASAELAVERLEGAEVLPKEISVISSNDIVRQYFEQYRPDVEPDDWKKAAVLGGSAGAVLAGLTSVAALVTGAGIPIVVASGFASFLTGGIVGSLAGAMTERGFETEAADYYELAVADGKTLVAVDLSQDHDPLTRRREIEHILAELGSEAIQLHKNPDFASK
jgi:hypothetical protein